MNSATSSERSRRVSKPRADHDALLDVVGPLPRLRLDRVAGRPLQRLPGRGRQVLGEGLEVGRGVEAEDEADARVGVPAVEVLGLGEVGVAAEQDLAEAGAEADGQGAGRPRAAAPSCEGRLPGRLTRLSTSPVLARETTSG